MGTTRGRSAALLLVLTLLLVAGPSGAAAASTPTALAGPVVLVGTPGLTWSDVSADTPALQAFLNGGAAGVVADRSVRTAACPVDGWLAVSAGRRAADAPPDPGAPAGDCRTPTIARTAGRAATVARWGVYTAQAAAAAYDARPGLLGDTLRRAGRSAVAIGPGAAIALARSDGTVAAAYPGGTSLRADLGAALARAPALVVIDLGSVRDHLAGGAGPDRATQVGAIDTALGTVTAALPASATVIVASLADSGAAPHLQLAAAGGPAPGGGRYSDAYLNSASTRQTGMVQTTDLFPTLLQALAVPVPDAAVGSVIRPAPTSDSAPARLVHLLDLEAAAQAVRPIVPIVFNGLVVAQILLYGGVTLLLRRRGTDPARRARMLTLLRVTGVAFACVPAATFLANLVPWWRTGHPGWSVTALVLAFTAPLCLIALAGPWSRRLLGPAAVVGGITAAVLAGDVLTGSRLMLSSLMGVQPLVAGRFYGFSNPAFALFSTGVLLLAIGVADALLRGGRRRAAVAAISLFGVLAVVVDGTPGLGSDFGGPPALVPAFAVLALLVAGIRLSWRRVLLIAVVTLAVLLVLAVGDWLRPAADRTHLGRFVQTTLDGGAWTVIRRKAGQNLAILFGSWLSALLPFAVAFVALVLARPVAWGARPLQIAYDRAPVLKHGLVAFAVLLALGFALNDTGTGIPAVAATVAIPALIAISAQALQEDDRARPRPRRDPRAGARPARPPRR